MGREEYSKIILIIHFHSISFPPPKRGLRGNKGEGGEILNKWNSLTLGCGNKPFK